MTLYEERIDLNRIAHELANILGWGVEGDDRESWYETLVSPEGWKIGLSRDRHGRNGRLRLSPLWPRVRSGEYIGPKDMMTYEERNALNGKSVGEMTVALERGMPAIAKDVKRRLVPVLVEWHDKIMAEGNRRKNTAESARVTAEKVLTAIVGHADDKRVTVNGTTVSFRAYDNGPGKMSMEGEVYDGGETISFRIRESWPTDDVLRLIAFVKSDFGRSNSTAA